MLYAFLRVHFADTGSGIAHFMISTNFPKKDLTDKSATLEAEVIYCCVIENILNIFCRVYFHVVRYLFKTSMPD